MEKFEDFDYLNKSGDFQFQEIANEIKKESFASKRENKFRSTIIVDLNEIIRKKDHGFFKSLFDDLPFRNIMEDLKYNIRIKFQYEDHSETLPFKMTKKKLSDNKYDIIFELKKIGCSLIMKLSTTYSIPGIYYSSRSGASSSDELKECIISYVSNNSGLQKEDCTIQFRKKGHFLMELSIALCRAIGIEKIFLLDVSKVKCKIDGLEISLRMHKIMCEGKSWYANFGFKDIDPNTEKMIEELRSVKDKNILKYISRVNDGDLLPDDLLDLDIGKLYCWLSKNRCDLIKWFHHYVAESPTKKKWFKLFNTLKNGGKFGNFDNFPLMEKKL